MKTIRNIFITAIAILFIASSTAQTALPLPTKGATVEGITQYKLANGMKVLLFPDQSKATITVNITYLVGSRHEGYGETGMAHLLEHMVFKGSTNHPNVPQELTAHGARPNGTTWLDRTNYFETFSASEENLKWALDLESDRMINSFIADSALRTEFSVVRNEFEMGENNPSGVLNERVMSTAYIWHNYGQSTIGSKEDIERVPIQNLKAFYKKYYQPDNAVLLVAGKIDEEKTIKWVNERFGVIPKPTRTLEEPYTVEPTQDGERFVELKRVGDVQVTACGYHICSGSHEDYPSVELLADILTNAPSGRLYKALVETKKATSGYGFSFELKDPGYMYFSYDVLKDKSLDDAKKTMLDLLDNLVKNPVTQEEVDRAKNKFMKNFDLTYNNSNSVGLNLSEYIAQGDWRLWFLLRDRIEKVTAADVNAVIGKYIKPSNRTVGVFIPDSKPERAEIPAALDVTALVKSYKGKAALGEAEAFDPSPANIDSRTRTGNVAGGAKYALLYKSTRGSSVNAQITLRIGTETSLQNKTVAADLAADMLNKGTKTKTRQQIQDEFDKLKASVGISESGQTVSINIQTVKENFVAVLKLVTEVLRQPSFPADEFDKLVQENLSAIEERKSDPQAIASNISQRILNPYPKNDFRYSMNFEEMADAYKNAKLDDVKKFYTGFYNSANATVGIVGAFDTTTIKASLDAMLANWTSAEKYERAKSPFFNVAAKLEKINTPDKANATMLCGYNIELRDDDADYMSLIMGNYMLGGGFLNSRLAVRIRQKEGISYGVGSWIQASPLDKVGGFGSYAIYNPDNSDKLVAAYKEELDRMLKDGFTTYEFKDARSGYLQGQNVSRAQDRSLAAKLASNLFLGRT
ncbi:MAG TPA: pitrilysin family protein, partial [Bacteroidia bacterium]|nr:pitrilysin family protein [Bacteroidia bacterium]